MWESYIDGFSRLRRENPSESLYGGTSQRRGEKCLAAPVEIWYAGSKGVDPVYLFDLDGTITDTNNPALERFGLADYFTAVVYAEEIGLEKRDPACFVELGRRLGADLADCTLFDDSPDNCATAAKAGLDTVGVYDSYYAHRQEELRAVCRRYVRSLEELVK